MIKFFRKFRYDLMNQNKTAKSASQRWRYFKYAIGEIVLVVIGILIALSINNWNENRKDRLEEKALLTQLQSEFQSNLEQLNEKVDIRNKMIAGSLKLLHYAEDPSKVHNDSIIKYLIPTTLSPTFDPIVNDLISSGRIQLLSNSRLRELLSLWTSEIVQVTEIENQWLNYQHQYYLPFLVDHSSIRNIFNSFWQNNIINSFNLNKSAVVELNLKKSRNHIDESKFFVNHDFEDHLAFCATMAKIANTQSKSLKNRISEILRLIEMGIDI